jgi:predicted O-methyltransferase YrrM
MTVYNDQLSLYINDLFIQEDPTHQRVRQDSANFGLPAISVKPEEGKFLQFLTRAVGAQKALEIGTLGGYSGIWIARGLAPDGKLITLEKDARHAAIAQAHFEAAGVSMQVEIRVGEASTLLKALQREVPFDFVFIDADKEGNPAYLDWAIKHTHIGGAIAIHNAFRGGSVAGTRQDDDQSERMRVFNRQIANEPRLLSTIFPAGDGTVISVKVT